MQRPGHPRVVVVGAGFAGVAAAQALPPTLDVIVVDPGAWFEFLPNVHELVSGVKQPAMLRLDRRMLVARAGHRFRRARVERIDPQARRVHLADGGGLDYDALIVAAGAESATYGVPGVHEHALVYRDVEQCARIGRRVAALAANGRVAHLVIVGGGLEGIEALGEVLRRYRDRTALRTSLVEGRERLLPEGPPAVDAAIRRLSGAYAVRIVTGGRVTAVESDAVVLADGTRLAADATIWTGGPIPAPVLVRSGLVSSAAAWVDVDSTLRHRLHPEVFVAGDAAGFPAGLAKQAYHALDMGAHAAANVQRQLRGERPTVFRPSPKPMLVSFGDLTTFLVAGNLVIAAPALAAGKEAVFQIAMARLEGADRLEAVAHVGERLCGAVRQLLWPVVSSPRAWLGQARLDVLAIA
jgi:NADH dehydrogenase